MPPKPSIIIRLLQLGLWVLLGIPQWLQAQAPALDPYSLNDPRGAVSRHLYYLNQGDAAKSAEALFGGDLAQAEKEELAIKLKQIYDAKGDRVKVELIPNDPNYIDSTTNRARYVIFPDKYPGLYVEKYGNRWMYSRESVARIDPLFEEVIPNISSGLMKLVPSIGGRVFWGLQVWQYVGLLFAGLFSYVVFLILKFLFGVFLRRLYPRFFPNSTLRSELIAPVTSPLSWLLITLLLSNWLIPALLLPIQLSEWLILILDVITPILAVLMVYRLVDILAEVSSIWAGKTDTTMDDQLIPLVRTTARLVIIVFGLIFVLQNVGVNVTALLAGVSIGGLAIALAAQDTVKNFLGSISIFLDKPFQVGDFIDTGAFMGVVTEVGVRSSRLRAPDGAQVTIPNGKLVDMNITNHGVRTYRRFSTSLTVTYATSRQAMAQFVEQVREISIAHPESIDESVIVQFHEMGSSSLNIFLAINFRTTAYDQWLKARQEVLLGYMGAAEELGIEFAFPSTSLYVESLPKGSTFLPPPSPTE
ncbi:MAG: mechanosensitive ion channel family protein [Bacteroidota bacterium]